MIKKEYKMLQILPQCNFYNHWSICNYLQKLRAPRRASTKSVSIILKKKISNPFICRV